MYQEAVAAAGNPAKAMELWEEAVRVTQFSGLSRESLQFKEWKNGEGEAMKEKEVLSALHLYFNWLALTLQRSSGASVHDLYNAVFAHAREAAADQVAMDAFNENLTREKEAGKTQPGGFGKVRVTEHDKREKNIDQSTKKLHDQILNGSVSSGLYAQAMKISDSIMDVAPAKHARNATAAPATEASESWEGSAGNVDGIYQQILLPEMRVRKDPHAIDYWDAKLRHETDNASKAKLAFEIDKFNAERRPQILWSRAREFSNIGLKNRAATEMFTVIKSFPAHPDATSWVSELTTLIAPPPAAPVASASDAASGAAAAGPGAAR